VATLPRNRFTVLMTAALLGLCAFGAIRAVSATRLALTGGSLDAGGLFRYPLWAILHFATASLFVLAVPIQFWPAFRGRYRLLHRWSGRALVVCAVILAGSGISLVYRMPDRPLGERVFMTTVFALFLCFLANAFLAARARDFVRHRRWMLRTVAVGLGAMTQRLMLPLFLAAGVHSAAEFWDKFLAAAWLSAILNVTVAEWWLRRSAPASIPADQGPENPMGTPPGARTIAIVTPSITRSGGIIASAPSRSA